MRNLDILILIGPHKGMCNPKIMVNALREFDGMFIYPVKITDLPPDPEVQRELFRQDDLGKAIIGCNMDSLQSVLEIDFDKNEKISLLIVGELQDIIAVNTELTQFKNKESYGKTMDRP